VGSTTAGGEEFKQRSEVVQLKIPNLEKKPAPPEKQHGQARAAKPPRLVQFPPMALATDKTVHLETPGEYFGIFKDDPAWMPMFEEIERRRDRQKIPTAQIGRPYFPTSLFQARFHLREENLV
jgi:hypothetical protein